MVNGIFKMSSTLSPDKMLGREALMDELSIRAVILSDDDACRISFDKSWFRKIFCPIQHMASTQEEKALPRLADVFPFLQPKGFGENLGEGYPDVLIILVADPILMVLAAKLLQG